jgi:hypothetical protein
MFRIPKSLNKSVEKVGSPLYTNTTETDQCVAYVSIFSSMASDFSKLLRHVAECR